MQGIVLFYFYFAVFIKNINTSYANTKTHKYIICYWKLTAKMTKYSLILNVHDCTLKKCANCTVWGGTTKYVAQGPWARLKGSIYLKRCEKDRHKCIWWDKDKTHQSSVDEAWPKSEGTTISQPSNRVTRALDRNNSVTHTFFFPHYQKSYYSQKEIVRLTSKWNK